MDRLVNAYLDGKMAPFFGAGMSAPFGNPNWAELIIYIAQRETDYDSYKFELQNLLDEKEYPRAVGLITQYINQDNPEYVVNKTVCETLNERYNYWNNNWFMCENNYVDILKLNCRNFFTFNYERFFEGIGELNNKYVISKSLLSDVLDSQVVDQNKTRLIWHVHGDSMQSSNIVLSEESYNQTYASELYLKKLEFMTNHFTFLFMGVSFDDKFAREFFKANRKYFPKSKHYIMFSDNNKVDKELFLKEYGLKVIYYKSEKGHVKGIKKKLKNLFLDAEENDKNEISHNGVNLSFKNGFNPIQLKGIQNNYYNNGKV